MRPPDEFADHLAGQHSVGPGPLESDPHPGPPHLLQPAMQHHLPSELTLREEQIPAVQALGALAELTPSRASASSSAARRMAARLHDSK